MTALSRIILRIAASLSFSAACRKALPKLGVEVCLQALRLSSASCRRLQVHHGESVLWRTGSLGSPRKQGTRELPRPQRLSIALPAMLAMQAGTRPGPCEFPFQSSVAVGE